MFNLKSLVFFLTVILFGAFLVLPAQVFGVTLIGAGDIGSNNEQQRRTAALLDQGEIIITMGDNSQASRGRANYEHDYEYWAGEGGRNLPRTRPSPGNHDYWTQDGDLYYDYFTRGGSFASSNLLDARNVDKGWYSYTADGWLILSLNSERMNDEQKDWIETTLENSQAQCQLVYFHRPPYTSTGPDTNSENSAMQGVFRTLYEYGVEVVLSGHNHHYERFKPLDGEGNETDEDRGIVAFIVGTGGAERRIIDTVKEQSAIHDDVHWGVIKLELNSGGYSWQFLNAEDAAVLDQGVGNCHGRNNGTAPAPPAPGQTPPATSGVITPTLVETQVQNPNVSDVIDELGSLNKFSPGTDLPQIIGRLASFMVGIIGALGLMMFVYAGFLWMTSAGSAEKVKKAVTIIIWTALGMITMLSIYIILKFVFEAFGV
jgi:hypothetical protein